MTNDRAVSKKLNAMKRAEGMTDEEISAQEQKKKQAKLFAATAHMRGEGSRDDDDKAGDISTAADSEHSDVRSTMYSSHSTRATVSSRPSSRPGGAAEVAATSENLSDV